MYPYIVHGVGERALLEVTAEDTAPRPISLQRARELCVSTVPASYTDPTQEDGDDTVIVLRGVMCGHGVAPFSSLVAWVMLRGRCADCNVDVPWRSLRRDTHTPTTRLLRGFLVEGRSAIPRRKIAAAVEMVDVEMSSLAAMADVLRKIGMVPPSPWIALSKTGPLSIARSFRFLAEGVTMGSVANGLVVEVEDGGDVVEIGWGPMERNVIFPRALRRAAAAEVDQKKKKNDNVIVVVLRGSWEMDVLLGRIFLMCVIE